MKHYKFIVLCCMLSGLIGVGTAQANVSGINILSEAHHVWGYAGVNSYDQTDSSPLDVAVTGTSFDGFGVYAHSLTEYFYVETETVWFDTGANAEIVYLFTPEVDQLFFDVEALGITNSGIPHETYAGFSLTDVTTGLMIEDYGGDGVGVDLGGLHYSYQNTFYFDLGHTYELSLYAHAGPGDATRSAQLTMNIHYIPTPSAILLGSIGVGCVHWLRRRRAL